MKHSILKHSTVALSFVQADGDYVFNLIFFFFFFFKDSEFGRALSKWELLLFSILMKLSDVDLNCK